MTNKPDKYMYTCSSLYDNEEHTCICTCIYMYNQCIETNDNLSLHKPLIILYRPCPFIKPHSHIKNMSLFQSTDCLYCLLLLPERKQTQNTYTLQTVLY